MYRVALVDDEDIFVHHLSGAIAWEHWGCTLCGTARDGTEALALIREQKPQIVFMDINMSVMNGLDVCAAIRDWPDAPHVIILSAHGEFSYAQQAIRLGVFGYLLKPFNEIELQDTLEKCIADIRKAEEQAALRQGREDAAVTEYLRGLLAGRTAGGPPEPLAADCYVAALVKRDPGRGTEQVLRSLRAYFQDFGIASFPVEAYGNAIGLVHGIRDRELELNAFQRHYSVWMQGEEAAGCDCVSIGSMVREIGQLPESYNEAVTGMENRINVGKDVVAYGDLEHLENRKGTYTPGDIQLLIKCFDAGEYEKADGIIEKIFAISQNQVLSFQYVVSTYYSIVISIYTHYGKTEYAMADYLALQKRIVEELGTCNHLSEMVAIIKNYIHEVFSDCIAFSGAGTNNALVRKIQGYLARHYADQSLTVDAIARALFFENSYIRRVYKSATGRTIMQQLEELRIEKAKELIEGEDCKISEVARLTGFSDQFYFSRRFKLLTNLTPTEYKNIASITNGLEH